MTMITKYTRSAAVRKYAKERGKRVSPSFLYWMDIQIEGMVRKAISATSAVTLRAEDSEAIDAYTASQGKRLLGLTMRIRKAVLAPPEPGVAPEPESAPAVDIADQGARRGSVFDGQEESL